MQIPVSNINRDVLYLLDNQTLSSKR